MHPVDTMRAQINVTTSTSNNPIGQANHETIPLACLVLHIDSPVLESKGLELDIKRIFVYVWPVRYDRQSYARLSMKDRVVSIAATRRFVEVSDLQVMPVLELQVKVGQGENRV